VTETARWIARVTAGGSGISTVLSPLPRTFRSGQCRRVLTSASFAGLVLIKASAEFGAVYCGSRCEPSCAGGVSGRSRPDVRISSLLNETTLTAALDTVALAIHLTSVLAAARSSPQGTDQLPAAVRPIATCKPHLSCGSIFETPDTGRAEMDTVSVDPQVMGAPFESRVWPIVG
jgi:hypothetical protein